MAGAVAGVDRVSGRFGAVAERRIRDVGALKIGSAVLLLVGIWVPGLIRLPALIVAVLMVGALAMHAKAKDAPTKYLPAFLMLVMSVAIYLLQ